MRRDHISDLGEFLLTSWHDGRKAPVTVYEPPGTRAIVDALFNQVFARDIAFARFGGANGPDIRDLVSIMDMDIKAGLICDTGQWRVFADVVNHGNSLGMAYADWPCLGYRIEAAGKVLAISGDTVACESLDRLTHIRPKSAALMQALMADVQRHFAGEVIVGENLMVVDV